MLREQEKNKLKEMEDDDHRSMALVVAWTLLEGKIMCACVNSKCALGHKLTNVTNIA